MATKIDIDEIAKKRITRPASTVRLPKIHLYGRNKKGKTHFCTTAGQGKILIIDPEHGTDQMKTRDPHVWHIERWADMDEVYRFARYGRHDYTWFSVDGLTKISNLALKHVMRVQEERSLDRIPGFVQKQDYGKAGELMKEMLTNFHNLNAGVIFTSQERQIDGFDSEEDEDSEESSAMYVPDLPKGVRSAVNSIVDVIGRIYVVRVEDKEGEQKPQRRLWIGESTKYDTGFRSDFTLPDMLKSPTVPKLVKLIETGRATTRSA